jgi:hypothetical protein
MEPEWAGHIARMGEINAYKNWSEDLKGTDHSEDLGVDGKIILEWILWKYRGKFWTEFI